MPKRYQSRRVRLKGLGLHYTAATPRDRTGGHDNAVVARHFPVSTGMRAKVGLARHAGYAQRNCRELEKFLSAFACFEYSEQEAIEFGRIRAELRKSGRPIPDVDAQIAAIARCNDLIVLSADEQLQYVPSLRVENWVA